MSEEQKNEKILAKKISIDIFINILYAVIFMLYYVSLNVLNKFMEDMNFWNYIKSSCMVFLAIGIIAFEVAYKKDKGKYAIHGIEFLVISFYTLMIRYVVKVNNLDFEQYVTISSYVFCIYYILKCMIIFTKERKQYLKSLSDIKEIVKKDKPLKKEASKKKEKENKVEEINNTKKDQNKTSENKFDKKNKNKSKNATKKSSNKKKEKNIKDNKEKDKKSSKEEKAKSDSTSTKRTTGKKNESKEETKKEKQKRSKKQEKVKQDNNIEEKKQEQPVKRGRGRPKKEKQTV